MRTRTTTWRVAAATAAVLAVTTLPPTARADDGDHDEAVTRVDRQTAEVADATLVARATGWPLAAAVEHLRVQDRLSDLLARLAADYPDAFAYGRLAAKPGGTSVIRFKGAVPAGAADEAARSGLEVELVGGDRYSAAELRARARAVATHLRRSGYRELSVAVNFDQTIDAAVTAADGDASPDLPPDLDEGVRVVVVDGPLARPEHARGGANVLDGRASECTSGFTVATADGTTGVTTAAHCTGIDAYQQPSDLLMFELQNRGEHLGLLGDAEWKTAPLHVEPAEYYAQASELREVTAVEPWGGIAFNNWYCVYGRASNDRECDEVYSPYVLTVVDWTIVGFLVAMKNDNTIGGDSGGPWSYGTEATGIHHGDLWIWFKMRNLFTVADLLPSALGVTVREQ